VVFDITGPQPKGGIFGKGTGFSGLELRPQPGMPSMFSEPKRLKKKLKKKKKSKLDYLNNPLGW
jgi:hypothetical protein